MMTVHKFRIPLCDEFSLDLPVGAQIIRVGVQKFEPQMWVLVDTEARQVRRDFIVRGTGHGIRQSRPVHLGTFFMNGDSLVFHLFEVTP